MSLNKDQILAADDLPRERVELPEWGGAVWVRTFSGIERDEFEVWCNTHRGPDQQANLVGVRAHLAALCICDETGQRLFTSADAALLGKKSGAALGRIFDAACRLNRLLETDVEELTKNSAAGQSAGFGSDSRLPLAVQASAVSNGS